MGSITRSQSDDSSGNTVLGSGGQELRRAVEDLPDATWETKVLGVRASEPVRSPSRATEGGPSLEPEMIRRLEETSRYRVLRAVPRWPTFNPGRGGRGGLGVGVLLDLETTGLSVTNAEIIELGMVKFAYDRDDGSVFGILDRFSGLRQPWLPIPAEITRITGIDDDMVAGQEIVAEEVEAFLDGVDIVIAHNARFDRPFAEARWPSFSRLPWACSCTGVDWSSECFEGAKLGHLLMQAGFFHTAHRAVDDAEAALHLLALTLPISRRNALATLLETARVTTWRVWAERSPFEAKDVLKDRGYRWSPGTGGLPRSWYRDLPPDEVDAEVAFLERDILAGGCPRVVQVTARDRFTDRAGAPRPRKSS